MFNIYKFELPGWQKALALCLSIFIWLTVWTEVTDLYGQHSARPLIMFLLALPGSYFMVCCVFVWFRHNNDLERKEGN